MSTATACPCVAWVSSAEDSKRIVLPKPSFREDVGTIEVARAVQTANDWNKELCFTASWASSVFLCRSGSGTLPALSHLAGMPCIVGYNTLPFASLWQCRFCVGGYTGCFLCCLVPLREDSRGRTGLTLRLDHCLSDWVRFGLA